MSEEEAVAQDIHEDHGLSKTQIKWKACYRREHKLARKLEEQLHETRVELERYKQAFRDLARIEGLGAKLNELIGNGG